MSAADEDDRLALVAAAVRRVIRVRCPERDCGAPSGKPCQMPPTSLCEPLATRVHEGRIIAALIFDEVEQQHRAQAAVLMHAAAMRGQEARR